MALEELDESELGTLSVKKLMQTVDSYIKQPERLLDATFLLSIESTLVVKDGGLLLQVKLIKEKFLLMMS
jgi:elongation factor Tu